MNNNLPKSQQIDGFTWDEGERNDATTVVLLPLLSMIHHLLSYFLILETFGACKHQSGDRTRPWGVPTMLVRGFKSQTPEVTKATFNTCDAIRWLQIHFLYLLHPDLGHKSLFMMCSGWWVQVSRQQHFDFRAKCLKGMKQSSGGRSTQFTNLTNLTNNTPTIVLTLLLKLPS